MNGVDAPLRKSTVNARTFLSAGGENFATSSGVPGRGALTLIRNTPLKIVCPTVPEIAET